MTEETIRYAFSIACIICSPPIAFLLGNRLERLTIRGDRPIRSWLSEIGSDIKWFGSFLGAIWGVVITANFYFPPAVGLAIVASKIAATFFTLLAGIAAVTCINAFILHLINTQNLAANDRRNFLTLLPIATSAIKLALYFLFILLLLASFGINITPFLETGAIAALILGIAGQNILSDMLSTLFIFTDRLFYVGDRLSILCGDEWIDGLVISISLRYTILDRGNGRKIAVANRTLDKFEKISSKITNILDKLDE